MSTTKNLTDKLPSAIRKNKEKSTQKYIANKLGITEQYLSMLLSGKRKWTDKLSEKLKRLNLNGII